MYVFAFALQLLALLAAVGGGGLALLQLWQDRGDSLPLVEKAHLCISGALLLASALLLHALFWNDFSLQYVASYTDRVLPVFYRLTAFWAGQPGSMLFWGLAVALSGSVFACTRAYRGLSRPTRLWYWSFFYVIMGFFALVLTSWSNPFTLQTPVPPDGNGLNPLLQNPGMIFHPPLLFLGYGGFAVPACLALAQSLSGRGGEEGAWFRLSRPFIMFAWLSLTAGIVLGAWWAYMELGWGGYWAWDPVENASLIPWLIATAALHTLIVEDQRNKLGRVNAALMTLTTVSAFFATYLVRSGVIDSVHAFGDGSVGTPLTVFVLAGVLVALWIPFAAPARGEPLAGPASREGVLTLTAWFFLALAVIILTATMWPVISKLWTAAPQGLDARFYNRVCLPLCALLVLMMALCPWLGWDGGLRSPKKFWAVAAGIAVAAVVIWALGYRRATALLGASAAVGIGLGVVLLLGERAVRAQQATMGALGAHLGLALVALGVAFSGPYSTDRELALAKGETAAVGDYAATLLELDEGRRTDYEYIAARLRITRDNRELGVIAPERRVYDKFGSMQFSEVDVIPGLGNEIYASLLGLDADGNVVVKISVEPLVNWLWIGGAVMCLAPLLGLRRSRRKKADTDGGANAGPEGGKDAVGETGRKPTAAGTSA
ncbi:MAG: heme lyase CcmF/NrfE family subunit [Desulfovibrio desulfuricans]|jgi:cytochrome c-type biogenesis protein CcmF|nr:heme lyase CcmF/NrfE family subunit [Desulfovibrio desulfuricans]